MSSGNDIPYDPESGATNKLLRKQKRSADGPARPGLPRGNSSWDVFAGAQKSYASFNPANAAEPHLAFAEGDIPETMVARLYNYLLNVSIVTRWIIFIVPVAGLLWIPGILQVTKFPNATIWSVKLMWWSIWLTVAWVGWWASFAMAVVLPIITRYTLGVVAVGLRRYIDWLTALKRYIALFAWSLTIWVSFEPLIDARQEDTATQRSKNAVGLITRILFALYLCAAVLLFEKFSIQWIATKFHEQSYAERIAQQKFAISVLTTLYRHSHNIPGRTDTLGDGSQKSSTSGTKFVKRALNTVKSAAQTTTTAFGNVASEIAGSSILQPNSPQAMVQTALESANKTRLLARRLFYSFVKPGADALYVTDIYPIFGNEMDADLAFTLLDKDGNGDVTREEMEVSCLEIHREQLAIERSVADIDSAVGRLDNILMSIYVLVCILIIAVALEAQLATLITAAGTFVLGLSWLIGGSLSEVLTSIIFLFIKHPFDVGDRVDLAAGSFTVKQIDLLSTVFLDSNSTSVQVTNTVLSTLFIKNIRRSPKMSEPFPFDVAYGTTFEQLEELRGKMLDFVTQNSRDYQPSFDLVVVDIPGQTKMSLSANIMYKSNTQQGDIKARRRNKWVCALKVFLADTKIYGPGGNPDSGPVMPTQYTLVPWDEVKKEQESQKADEPAAPDPTSPMPSGGWNFTTGGTAGLIGVDVFGEGSQLRMRTPRRTTDESEVSEHVSGLPPSSSTTRPPLMPTPGAMSASTEATMAEEIELLRR